MSKQEEFGSEITKLIIIGNRDCIGSENIAQNILTYLKSQGVVVKKEKQTGWTDFRDSEGIIIPSVQVEELI